MSGDGPPHDPIAALADAFVDVPAVQPAIAAAEQLIRFAGRGGHNRGGLLVGPSFVGKSAIIDHLLRLHPPRQDGRQTIRPVCVARVQGSSHGGFLSVLLRALDDPAPHSGANPARLDRVLNHIEQQSVRLLVPDEVQELVDSDTDKIAYGAANVLKAILNAGACQMLVAGVSHATRITGTNRQLENRLATKIELRPYDWRLEAHQEEIQVFLDQIEERLALPEPSHLGRLDTAWRFAHFSRGLRGNMVSLLQETLERREMAGGTAPCITQAMLAGAADAILLREARPRPNPFRTDPPDDFEPAPMYEPAKEAPAAGRAPRDGADGFRA